MNPRHQPFFIDLINQTNNFAQVTWLGQPIWQNVLDLWTIQETIAELKPELLIESGTHRGGSALFYAHLFDLMDKGEVITIDVEKRHTLSHPRVTFLVGDSVGADVFSAVRFRVNQATGPVLVILDSNHSEPHVSKELDLYSPFVTPGSFLLCQDGVIDVLPMFQHARPGPLGAITKFLSRHPGEFEIDHPRSERFLITHHPMGWLRRTAAPKRDAPRV